MIPCPETIEENRKMYLETLVASIDATGAGLPQLMYWDHDKGARNMVVIDIPLYEPGNILWHAINEVDSAKTDYVMLAMDCTSKPDQGLEFDDFLLVYEFDRTLPEPFMDQWRIGVINYDKSADPVVVRPIDWKNTYWKEAGKKWMKRFGPPFRAIVKKA